MAFLRASALALGESAMGERMAQGGCRRGEEVSIQPRQPRVDDFQMMLACHRRLTRAADPLTMTCLS